MQTLTVAPNRSIGDGTNTYLPGQSVTVSDSDAAAFIASGAVLMPGWNVSRSPAPANVIGANGLVMGGGGHY